MRRGPEAIAPSSLLATRDACAGVGRHGGVADNGFTRACLCDGPPARAMRFTAAFVALLLASTFAPSLPASPSLASEEFAGTTLFRSVGTGHTVLELPADAEVASIEVREPLDEPVALLLSGDAFDIDKQLFFVRTPTFQMPPWDSSEFPTELAAGLYHVYIVAEAGVPVELAIAFEGAADEVEVALDPWTGAFVPLRPLSGLAPVAPPDGPASVEVAWGSGHAVGTSLVFFLDAYAAEGPGAYVIDRVNRAHTGTLEGGCSHTQSTGFLQPGSTNRGFLVVIHGVAEGPLTVQHDVATIASSVERHEVVMSLSPFPGDFAFGLGVEPELPVPFVGRALLDGVLTAGAVACSQVPPLV